MPLFDYMCPDCGAEVEVFKKYSNVEEPVLCQMCKTAMDKKVSASNFYLKGNGWYKDGYK